MGKKSLILRWAVLISLIPLLTGSVAESRGQSRGLASQETNYVIVLVKGQVEVARAGAPRFDPVTAGWPLFVGDRVRIGPRSHLIIRRRDQSIYRFPEKTEFQVQPARTAVNPSPTVRLLAGVLYFFHRGKPGPFEVETRTASAAVRGTEFNLQVDDAGTTTITVIDGLVDLSNAVDTVTVQSGQQGVASPGQAPFLRAAIDAINIIQWTLYYPGVLDADEVPLTEQERSALSASLTAYRSGDLLRAVGAYPAGREPQSDAERIYLAGLLLSVGQVDDAQKLFETGATGAITGVSTNGRLTGALQHVIATVKLQPSELKTPPQLASEWLAESYRLQSMAKLEEALKAAHNSIRKSPDFGFGWARVAELEFSFGRTDDASTTILKALQLSPRNAQAVSLKGFLLAAHNKIGPALRQFDEAIAIDPSLANAWLGRGLCLIRSGQRNAGREDLLTAAALEPQRAFLRSYLGKAWADAGEKQLAEHELELAKQFDPRDPTAWLYSALLKQQHNRINEAIRDLEHAQDLSTNRAIYRSGFLLDQDRAVRSANLARIYRDAGMTDWSIREAGRAVSEDYANYSAHLFLAESYTQLREPILVNLRYESPAIAEYLIGNLLAPVGAGILSPAISQAEYSKLFERNRLGLVSVTEYMSRGAWKQSAAQFGTFGNFSYSAEGDYQSDPGERGNNDLELEGLTLHMKQQLTKDDTLYFLASRREREGGDPSQRYDPALGKLNFRFTDQLEPALVLGYHREWNPQSHTLFSAIRTEQNLSVSDLGSPSLFVRRPEGPILSAHPLEFESRYGSDVTINAFEAQQIWAARNHQLIGGVRFQDGDIHVRNTLLNPTDFHIYFPDPGTVIIDDAKSFDFERFSLYGYHAWQALESLSLTAGLAYDRVLYPENFLSTPLSDDMQKKTQLSPKAGIIWRTGKNTTLRMAYAQFISGVGLDQSLQIEPTQVAGINQSYRELVPESFSGSTPGERFEIFGISMDQKLFHRTYFGVEAARLRSSGSRIRGSFETPPPEDLFALRSGLRENIEFEENSISLTVNQLVAEEWAFGLSYRLADAQFDHLFVNVPVAEQDPFSGPAIKPAERIESVLHKTSGYVSFNHRSGVFFGLDASWYKQDVDGYAVELDYEDFWQFNTMAGYRFWRSRAELSVSLLNMTDHDYRLLPLNHYPELPRERTLLVRLRWEL